MAKRKNDRELLFRDVFGNHCEIRLYRRDKKFILERIHNKYSMSQDVFDSDPETAYLHYEYLLKNKTTKFPYEFKISQN